jgi:hypothetical protein
MKGELSFEELEAKMDEVAAKFPEVKTLPEWKALRAEIRKAKKKGAKVMTLDVLDAADDFDGALVYYLASKAAGGKVPALMTC